MTKQELTVEQNKKVSLETLILEGEKTRIHITFDYPTNEGVIPVHALIKPINSVDWNNMVQEYSNRINEFNIAVLEEGLLTSENEHLPRELLEKMPAGVVDTILKHIMDISGIKQDKEEQYRLTKELLGF